MIETIPSTLNKERAAELAARSIHLRAVANTPLLELVNFTVPSVINNEGADYSFTQASDNGEHNTRLEEYADFLSETVAHHIDFARNVVTPVLDAIMDKTREVVSSLEVNPHANFKVEECTYPPVLDIEQFQEAILRYDTGTGLIPNVGFKYGAAGNEQLVELCHTGSANIDRLISVWLGELAEGQLQSIWQSIFMDKVANHPDAVIKTTEDLIKDYDQGLNNAVVVFLLCERLSQDITGDCGLDLTSARDAFFALRAAAVSAIRVGVQRYESFKATNTVVANYSKATSTLRVNRQVYREWIASGGKVEVLFGYMVLGQTAITKAEIEADATKALEAWNWYSLMSQGEQDAKFVGDVKAAACHVFDQALEEPKAEAEQEALAMLGANTSANASVEFRNLISQATADQIRKNYVDVIWRAACQARFGYTHAYEFLSEMNYEINERGQDPQDAATQATATYICAYIAGMVEVVSV